MKLLREFLAIFILLGLVFLLLHAILPTSWLASLGITQ
jgi:hypothetical protein